MYLIKILILKTKIIKKKTYLYIYDLGTWSRNNKGYLHRFDPAPLGRLVVHQIGSPSPETCTHPGIDGLLGVIVTDLRVKTIK